jgi:hypothetical protein
MRSDRAFVPSRRETLDAKRKIEPGMPRTRNDFSWIRRVDLKLLRSLAKRPPIAIEPLPKPFPSGYHCRRM